MSGVAREYGFARHSLDWHKSQHLSRQLVRAAEMREHKNCLNLAEDLIGLKEKAQEILERAESRGQDALALRGLAEARSTIEVFARLGLMLQQGRQINEAENKAKRMKNLQNLSRAELETLERLLLKAENGAVPENEPVETVPYDETENCDDLQSFEFEVAEDEPVELNFDPLEQPHPYPARRRRVPDIQYDMTEAGKVCFKPLISMEDLENG